MTIASRKDWFDPDDILRVFQDGEGMTDHGIRSTVTITLAAVAKSLWGRSLGIRDALFAL
jgi:hypothetical protein